MNKPENMRLERAMEILDPCHREHYDSIEPVNEACPTCGSGEYLCNEDGNTNRFCGQCGQAIDWEAGK